jgi:uncharacterized protein YrrD
MIAEQYGLHGSTPIPLAHLLGKDTSMQKMNELFGKRVISQLTGDQVAVVRDVVLDREARHIVALILTNEHSSDEQVVRIEQILGMGEFIVVDGARPFQSSASDAEIIELRKSAEQITGKKIISATGEQFGTVSDMYFGRNGVIVGFELKRGPFGGSEPQVIRATDVQAVGKDAVIARTNQPIALGILAAEETPAVGPAEGNHT